MGYIDKLEAGQMWRLRSAEGETPLAVRRRLGMAAKLSGKRLEIRNMKAELSERWCVLLIILDAVYVDTVEEKRLAAIRPKPSFRPLLDRRHP